jgi:signal transduction histidine kinase
MREWVGRIHRALGRLGYIVNQIIAMLEAGHFERPLNVKPVALEKLVAEAVEDVRPFAELRGQKLVESLPTAGEPIPLDAEKIRDCVNHLVLNAIKFTPDGGTITVSADRDGTIATVRVADTGCGIEPAHLPRVGEAFFTGYDVARHSSGQFEHGRQGMGLGLSVVKSFVAMHGGSVEVTSQAQCGTTVTLTLPTNPPPPPPPPPSDRPA